MTVYLVRHGQDDESVRGGWCNHGLVEEGRIQSLLLGERLATIRFDKIISSDLNRAVETAEIISKKLIKQTPIEYTKELREMNNGLLAGMKHEVAEEKFPGVYYKALKMNEKFPSGESPNEFYQRILAFYEKNMIDLKQKNILIVTHGGVIDIMLRIINDIPYTNQENKFPIKTGTFVKVEL